MGSLKITFYPLKMKKTLNFPVILERIVFWFAFLFTNFVVIAIYFSIGALPPGSGIFYSLVAMTLLVPSYSFLVVRYFLLKSKKSFVFKLSLYLLLSSFFYFIFIFFFWMFFQVLFLGLTV